MCIREKPGAHSKEPCILLAQIAPNNRLLADCLQRWLKLRSRFFGSSLRRGVRLSAE